MALKKPVGPSIRSPYLSTIAEGNQAHLRPLILSILVLIVLLLASSALGLILNPGDIPVLGQFQSYGGLTLLGLSIVLAVLNLWLIRHPFYELWLIIMAGSIVGAIYAV